MTPFAVASLGFAEALGWTWLLALAPLSALGLLVALALRATRASHAMLLAAIGFAAVAVVTTFVALKTGAAPIERLAWLGSQSRWSAAIPALGWIWVAATSISVVGLVAGCFRLAAWRRDVDSNLPSEWTPILTETALRFQVSPQAALAERIESAMTFGWRRPIVLLPACARGWSESDLRMVLAHEFEHVRRRDFAWNVIQSLFAAVCCPHPAVIWIGRSARAEREFRCDDRAVAAAGCAATYVRLLAALENARPRRFQPASSLAGSLAARCARLLGCERQTFPRGLVVAGALALLLGFATAHAIASNKPPEKSKLLWCGCAMGPP